MFCRFCGTTEAQFRISGKFGCEHCVTLFPYPKQKNSKVVPASLMQEIQTTLTKCEDKIWILSLRIRITRNLSHVIFPYYDPKEEHVKRLLAENNFSAFLGIDEGPSRLYLGSEDHLRWEILQSLGMKLSNLRTKYDGVQIKNLKGIRSLERFLHQKKHWAYASGIGFLSSCPTNLGKGRRDSLLLGIEAGIDPSFFSLFEKLSEFGIEFAPSSDHRRESLGNFRGLVVKISWKNAFAVQKRQFYKILGLRGSL
ncbi:ATP--guanido phosphotransferase [Leptospira sp. WS60.C2]